MKKINKGDIWVTLIPKIINKNNKTQIEIEKRPCLIIDNGRGFLIEENVDCLGLKITTKDKKNTILIKDWDKLGLKRRSYIRIEVPMKIEKTQLVKKIGKVNEFDMYVYLERMVDYFNVDVLEAYKRGRDE